MAKKRKASAQPSQDDVEISLDVGESRKRIRDFEDVAGSDDEFHINRDEVLLDEGPDAKRRRKWQEAEEFLQASDEEVLGYSESEDEDVGDDADGAVRVPSGRRPVESDLDEEDEDVQDQEEGMGWGTSKVDLYGADAIETEEQALEEEAEALRLQKKQLQSMSAADYGFDESEWQNLGDQDAGEEDAGVVTEVLPQLQIAEDLNSADRLKLLKARYPEFEPLSKELLQLQETHATLARDAEHTKTMPLSEHTPIVLTKLRAASAYVGALTMYFALLTSPASNGREGVTAMSATQLRDHPVMDSLVQCRELWQMVKDLRGEKRSMAFDIDATHEVGHGLTNGDSVVNDSPKDPARARKPKKSRAQRHAEAAEAAAEARKAERLQRTEAGLADLDSLVAPAALRKPSRTKGASAARGEGDSDLGEEAPLTAKEAADKASRKKSLRFYTSQIAQKANKRGASGRNAGGDEDIPHRERLRDRQARLNAEAEKRGKRPTDAGAELGGESDEEDTKQAQQIRADNDDDYYDLIAAKTAKKKSDKTALATAQREAEALGGRVVEEATLGPDGKRKISYLIEKNKGLTPHRKKEVRNPRVKKRKKYEEKKKKLASIKPVYKGGERRGGYGGELTGIKKGVVKSTKL